MNKIIEVMRKPARLVAVIALSVAAGCILLSFVGSFPNEFMPVMGHLFSGLLRLGVVGILLYCLLARDDKLLGYVLPLVLAWWLISSTFNLFGDAYGAVKKQEGLVVAIAIFEFVVALATLASIVLLVLSKAMGKEGLRKIAFLILYCSLAVQLLVMILWLALDGQYDAPWGQYFSEFASFALPAGLLFAAFPRAFGEGEPIIREQEDEEPASVREAELLDEEGEPIVEEPAEPIED